MELHGNGFNGPLWWTGRAKEAAANSLPTQLPAPGSAEGGQGAFGGSPGSAVNRKSDEAQAAYEKIAKDYPNTAWARAAQEGIGSLRLLKESHIQAGRDREGRGSSAEQKKAHDTRGPLSGCEIETIHGSENPKLSEWPAAAEGSNPFQ